jgi:uncharacterized DUF497 family protein
MNFSWDEDKNNRLKQKEWRFGIWFEDISEAIMNGWLVDVKDHHNQKDYFGQNIFFVRIKNYIYSVPTRKIGNTIHLITIHPNRKATKFYLTWN